MRLLLAAATLTLIALPAAAQDCSNEAPIDVTQTRPPPCPQTSFNRAERLAMRPYRAFDWDSPEPGKGGYFADDYRTIYSTRPRSMGMGDRVYRGRDGHYYCRSWDGFTKRIENDAMLGELLPAGGSERLKTLSASNPALADAVKRHEVRCGGDVVLQLRI
jgi:hypothetical protein